MKAMKFRKIKDEGNYLGFEELIIVDKIIQRVIHLKELPYAIGKKEEGDVYEYEYEMIADNSYHTLIACDEWHDNSDCYEFCGFVD